MLISQNLLIDSVMTPLSRTEEMISVSEPRLWLTIPIGSKVVLALSDGFQSEEIIYGTSLVGRLLAVERAQENTTAKEWRAGTVIQSVITSGLLAQFALKDA